MPDQWRIFNSEKKIGIADGWSKWKKEGDRRERKRRGKKQIIFFLKKV